MKMINTLLGALLCTLPLLAQNAAVSSHTNFGSDITGDITISEVRIPADGIATNTYYETLGFWGNKGNATGNGYGGIQESSDGRGNKVHIFSIWHALDNPNDTANFPYVVHLAHGMEAEYFGGEGVGLKTWNLTSDPNHPLYWIPDVWYTHVVRTWDVNNHTYYGFFVRDGVDGTWRHLSTIGVREANIRIKGRNDAFIEDWSGSGQNRREIHLRNNWRRDLYGNWKAAKQGAYSVNYWDLEPGKRSYNYRYNWDGGTRSDNTGEYYYMTTGGATTAPTPPLNYPNKMSNTYYMEVQDSTPDFTTGKVSNLFMEELPNGTLALEWEMDDKTLPLFSYTIEIYDNESLSGSPLLQKSALTPHARKDTLDISSLNSENQKYYLAFKATDIFDGKAAPVAASFGQGEVTPFLYLSTPAGGEHFLHGDTMTISWKSNQNPECILSLISNDTEEHIIDTVAMSSSPLSWKVSDMLSERDDYRVVIKTRGIPELSDTSTPFVIAAPDSIHWLMEQSKLQVYSFTNEQDQSKNAAANVLDGDPNTIWHTDWNGSDAHPHEIVLKADTTYNFSGLLYLPRQSGTNGTIKEYDIYVSENGSSWSQSVASGSFTPNSSEKRIEFPSRPAQYVKLVSRSEINSQAFSSAAELNLLHNIKSETAQLSTVTIDKNSYFSIQKRTVTLHLPATGQYSVTLHQLNGRELFSQKLTGGRQELPLIGATGVCILSIRGENLIHKGRVLLP